MKEKKRKERRVRDPEIKLINSGKSGEYRRHPSNSTYKGFRYQF